MLASVIEPCTHGLSFYRSGYARYTWASQLGFGDSRPMCQSDSWIQAHVLELPGFVVACRKCNGCW